MYTHDKIEALRKILSRVLRATLTRDELEAMRMNGITISDVIDRGYYDETFASEAQKCTMVLMSRQPLDDPNDLLVWYYRNGAGEIVFRNTLGVAGDDTMMENFKEVGTSMISAVSDLLNSVGLNKSTNDRFGMDNRSGDIIQGVDYGEDELDTAMPVTTFVLSQATFVKMLSRSGGPNWNDI